MPSGKHAANPREWLVEVVAGICMAVVIGVWTYQTLNSGRPDVEVTLLFVSVAGCAVIFLFGVDRLRAWWSIASEHR